MKTLNTLTLLGIFVIVLAGCGGGGTAEQTRTDPNVGVIPNYRSLSPAGTTILTSNHATFKFERDTDNSDSSTLCISSSSSSMHDVKFNLVEINTTNGAKTTLLRRTLQVPNNCIYSFSPTLTLQEYHAYAWYVSEPNAPENNNTKWNRFVYATNAIDGDETDIHQCNGNLVKDWSFLENRPLWNRIKLPSFTLPAIAQRQNSGHDDNGSAYLSKPYNNIYQVLQNPIEQGKYYTLKLSIKHEGKADFQIRALAFNGDFNSTQANSDTALIGLSGRIVYHQGDWVKVTFPSWRANKNFSKLAIVLDEANGTVANAPLFASIDRVCLSETGFGGCEEGIDNAQNVPPNFDFNNSDPVITNFEYLAGTVQDLHYTYDTSNVSWYEDANDTLLQCSSIGGDLTDDESDEIDSEMDDPDLDLALSELNQTKPQVLSVLDNNESNITNELHPITFSGNPDQCKKAYLDPTKPFMGRDIVYIHGLQEPALKGTLKNPPTFQEKWPQDKALFYSGGDIITQAKRYWSEHIKRELGSSYDDSTGQYVGTPSNSFLIVSWSANQRIDYAMHAILTQISDAMAGNNPNVYLSRSATAHNQCFGDNGIVVITHSTGGLIASAMFGIAENSNDTTLYSSSSYGAYYNIHDIFGDVRYIRNKIVAQIGLNSAYGGTAFAATALKVLTSIQESNIFDSWVMQHTFDKHVANLSYSQIDKLLHSTLVDLHPSVAATRWRPWMSRTTIPSLLLNSSYLGKAEESPNMGKKLNTGFDDLVLAPFSQANRYTRRPVFSVKHKRKLKDKGIDKDRWKGQIKDGKKASGTGKRNYFNTPYVAPSGMLQYVSVDHMIDPTNDHIANHYLVMQTTGTHFDSVNKIYNYGLYSYETTNKWSSAYEETAMVFDTGLYGSYISNSFANINEEWVRKETWGFHFVKITWPHGLIPKFSWHYYEYIKWKRTYNLAHGYKNLKGADYMYKYLLRP